MKFVAFLGTKDVVEVVGPCIDHLRRIGVELVIVVDYGSIDGTLEAVAEREVGGDIWTLRYPRDVDYDTHPLRSELFVELARSSNADWVLLPAPDEFWLPAGGSLHGLEELTNSDVLEVETYSFLLSRREGYPDLTNLGPAAYESIWLHDRPPERDRWPKIMARPEVMAGVAEGDHDIRPAPGRPLRRSVANDLLVAEVSFTTLAAFQRKIANIRRFHAANTEWFAQGNGSHWLEYLHNDDAGKTDEYFESLFLDDEAVADLHRTRAIRSAADLLANRASERRDA
jgi:hypothetical protein